MARKMKKFSAGGAQGRYEHRMKDIEKDRKIALAKGKNADVAEAKAAQRIADAKDDLAKRTGADRTATRKAEFDAEKTLTRTRKFGADKPVAAAQPVKATTPAAETPKAKPQSFAAAFKDARSRLGAGKTFTFNGKSFTTNIAGEVRKPAQRSTTTASTTTTTSTTPKNPPATTAAAAAPKNQAAAASTAPKNQTVAAKVQGPSTKTGLKPNSIAGMIASGKLFGTSDAFRKSQEAKYGKAKGGKIKKEKTMKYAKGGSTPPQPSAADRARSKKHLDELKKLKPSAAEGKVVSSANRSEGPGYKKGGKAKAKSFAATKFGAAMMKKSADTKGRAMPKFAKGGSIDGCAVKGKTKTSMVKMKKGGSC